MAAFEDVQSPDEQHAFNGGVLGQRWSNRNSAERNYFVFSAVRNPFDRIVSAWRYLPALRDLPLEVVLTRLPQEGHDYRHITLSQSAMLRDLETERLVTGDLIRFEALQGDFDRVCDRLGKPRRILDHLNKGDRVFDYRVYYTATSRALVESIFKEDLELFSYTF